MSPTRARNRHRDIRCRESAMDCLPTCSEKPQNGQTTRLRPMEDGEIRGASRPSAPPTKQAGGLDLHSTPRCGRCQIDAFLSLYSRSGPISLLPNIQQRRTEMTARDNLSDHKGQGDCDVKCPECGEECIRTHETAKRHKCKNGHKWSTW